MRELNRFLEGTSEGSRVARKGLERLSGIGDVERIEKRRDSLRV